MNIVTSPLENGELLSALADGELRAEELASALELCREGDLDVMARWNSYHVIGGFLRGTEPDINRGADPLFLQRLAGRLGTEKPDRKVMADSGSLATPLPGTHVRGPASNDESFRWKVLAGFASFAAMSAIAWHVSVVPTPASAPQLSQATPTEQVVVDSPQGPIVRDARLEELLAAHRQLGGLTALQAPSGFLRNAAFETSQDKRR